MSTKHFLHERFNPRSDQIPPVRVKRFTRDKLAAMFAELGFRRGAEVGTADGQNALRLCKVIPKLDLLCVDPWEPYKQNPRGGGTSQQHGNYELASERLALYGARLVRKMSVDAARDVRDGSLDFVYIDGNHGFDFVIQDLIVWSAKVKSDGIIAGHDYYRFRWAGVVDAVDAYTRAHQIHEWFVDDMREASFFWANDWR